MAAHKNITKLKEFNSVIISDFYDKSKSIEEIAEYYHLDIPLTWAIILEGKKDLERFELFGESDYGNDEPKLYNLGTSAPSTRGSASSARGIYPAKSR